MKAIKTSPEASQRTSKLVLANGVFDLFHYRHLLYLEAAAGVT